MYRNVAIVRIGYAESNYANGMYGLFSLLQICEGTNQLNRLNLFKSLVARNYPQVKVFEPE